MSVLLRRKSLWRLTAVLGLALMGLVFAPGASAAPLLDTVNVIGSTSNGALTNINISAQSGTSGQDPSGTVSATVNLFDRQVSDDPVFCLSVTGPDRGAGTSAAPTTATFNVNTFNVGGVVKVMVVDNGGNGADQFAYEPFFSGLPTDCSPIPPPVPFVSLSPGRAVVFDAPVPPTPVIITASLPNGFLNQPYFFQLEAEGGTPPYSWNKYPPVGSGRLPLRLSLSKSGLISGIPKRTGTFPITVKCLDSSHSHKTQAVKTFTLTINR